MRSVLLDIALAFLKMCILFVLFTGTLLFVLVIYPPALIPILAVCAITPVVYVRYTYRHPTCEDVLLVLDEVSWKSLKEINLTLSCQKYFTKRVPHLLQELEIAIKIERDLRHRYAHNLTGTIHSADRFRIKSTERKSPAPHSAPISFEPAPMGF